MSLSMGLRTEAINPDTTKELQADITQWASNLEGEHDIRPIIIRDTPMGACLFLFDHATKEWYRQDIIGGSTDESYTLVSHPYLTEAPQ